MPERPTPPRSGPASRPSLPRPATPRSAASPRPAAMKAQAFRPAPAAPAAKSRVPKPRTAPSQEVTSGSKKPNSAIAKPESGSKVVVSTLNERLAERAHRDRVRNWRKLGWWAAVVAALALLVWLAFFSSLFALDKSQISIDVQGEYIDAAAVNAIVAPYLGVPLPRIDTVNLRSELGELGAVRTVTVNRIWPDGLSVTLLGREPVAAVPDGAGAFVLVDGEGTAIATVAEVPQGTAAIEIPLLEGAVDERILRAVLEVLNKMPEELTVQVERIYATTLDDISLNLADGAVVVWGSAENSELKGEVLRVLRTSPDVSEVAVYDVSAPEMPITKAAAR